MQASNNFYNDSNAPKIRKVKRNTQDKTRDIETVKRELTIKRDRNAKRDYSNLE